MKKFFAFLIFFLINLFIFEVLLTFFDIEKVMVKSYDSKILFSMYPNKIGKVVSEEFSISIKTNENGFRQTIPINYDTILIGDSFTEGWGVEEEEIYTYHLNKKLPEGKKVLNLGLHGSSPILYAWQIKFYIEKFKPKRVIIQLFDNDLDDNEKLERFFVLGINGNVVGIKKNILVNLFGESIHNFIKESTLYRILNKVYKFINKIPSPILFYKPTKEPKLNILNHDESILKYGKLKSLGDEIYTKYNNQFSFYDKSNYEKWEKSLTKNKTYLNQIQKIAKENKVELSFIYIPAKEFFASNGITGKLNTNKLNDFNVNNPFYLQIKEFCDTESLKCFYVNDLFFYDNPEELYFPFDAHLNRKGHELLAEKLFKIYTPLQ